ESLDPCTFYTCVVSFRSNVDEKPPSADQIIYAYTEYKREWTYKSLFYNLYLNISCLEPRTTVKSLEPTSNTIKISWQTTDRACVENFEINARASATGFGYNVVQLNEKSTYTFDKDIKACLTHTITLLTRNNASVVVDTDVNTVDTLYAEPGDLSMNVTNLANGITMITWNDPVEEYCISNYEFKWRRDECPQDPYPEESTTMEPTTLTTPDMDYDLSTTMETPLEPDDGKGECFYLTEERTSLISPILPTVECNWSESSSDGKLREYLLMDLQGCEPYTFEIFINENLTSKASQQFTSAEKLPSIVFEPTLSRESTTEGMLNWTWSEPQDHPKCVANYSVSLTGPSQRPVKVSKDLVTEEKTAVFENLDPCGIYTVEIVPIMLNGTSGASYKGEGTVQEDQPSEILDPVVTTYAFSLDLSWEIPAYADLCIDGYRLSGWTDDDVDVEALSVTTKETSVSFSDLVACQMYTIQIIPYTTEKRDGGTPRQVPVEMRAAVVSQPKIKFEKLSTSSHSIELSALNNDFNNSCPTIYALFNCTTNENVPFKYADRYVEGHTLRGFQANVNPLSPSTSYLCYVILYNVAGPSERATETGISTANYFPERPENLQNVDRTAHSLQFNWDPPTYLNGALKFYQVFLMLHEPNYFMPEDCTLDEWSKSETNALTTSNYSSLASGMKYMIQVAAQNDFGMGDYTAPVIGITLPSGIYLNILNKRHFLRSYFIVSDNVTQLTVSPMGPYPDPEYSANVTITWTVPCRSNGEIEYFQLDFSGTRTNHKNENFTRQVPLDTENKKGRMSYTETEMQPEYEYKVTVAVKNFNVDELSGGVSGQWQSPAGLPSRLGEDLVGQMRVKTDETNHPTKSAVVRLPASIMNSESGEIKYVALLVSQKNCAGASQPELGFEVSKEWPNSLTYEDAGGDGSAGCVAQYQTTPFCWSPVAQNSARNRRSSHDTTDSDTDSEIVFTIGEDKCPNNDRFCNGPLLADTEYYLVVRLFTSSGYSDAALLEFKTEAAIKVTLILVSVCSCLLLAFVIGLVVLWVRKRIAWHRDSGQGIEDPFGNIIAKNFAIFYSEVAKPEKLAREFKEITVAAVVLSYAASELGCHKNRYADIYPCKYPSNNKYFYKLIKFSHFPDDKNRVILDIDAEGSDYINASFVDGHTRKKEYIATQGPKPESVMDFWRMVLQYNVRIIVQVTQFREGNIIKCHEYFPYTMRGLTVTVKSKESFDLYDRTELTVVHDKYGFKEKVVHFYFKKWPDHGVPEDPMHLITFVKKVKSERRPTFSPIVVHCSAGVGRTGTFIGLDIIMQRLKSESKINIFETVKKLRFQRMKMVQTIQQYTFLYACTYELVKHKIPRAALKLENRPKPANGTVPPLSAPKKVSFPDVDTSASGDSEVDTVPYPDPEVGVPVLQLPARYAGQRKSGPQPDSISITSTNM
ncbi:hypothetical protein KR067_013028, partial [Drosophila pandora]